MDFYKLVDQVATLLQQRGKQTYRSLRRQFDLILQRNPDTERLPREIWHLYRECGWWTPQDLKQIRRLIYRGIEPQ